MCSRYGVRIRRMTFMTSPPLQNLLCRQSRCTPKSNGATVWMAQGSLPCTKSITRRSELSFATLYHEQPTSTSHLECPLKGPATVANVLPGSLPTPRVASVHPVQADTQSSAETLMLTHSKVFVVFQQTESFSHRTNSDLRRNLNFGHSSPSHSFHTMSVPSTICSLSLQEDAAREASHSMNVHFHLRVQQPGMIPDAEP